MKLKKLSDGWVVPEYEAYLQGIINAEKWLTIARYQRDRLDLAYTICKKFDIAIDVGANIGIFTSNLAKKFKHVIAFEPAQENQSCLVRNLKMMRQENYTLYKVAIGEQEKSVKMQRHFESCVSHFLSEEAGEIKVKTLDSFQLETCDLLKIDVEGYEYFVIQGALETIKRCRPVIILEEKNFNNLNRKKEEFSALKVHPEIPLYAARRCLEDLDYNILGRIGHDFILNPI